MASGPDSGNGDALRPRELTSLLAQHWPSLHAYLRLHTGAVLAAKESVEDLAQSVCREVLEHAAEFEFRGESAFRKWLFTHAAHKIADRGRFWARVRRDAAREQPPCAAPRGDGGSEVELLQSYATICTPSRNVMAREETARIERAIRTLPEDQREAILMSRLGGLTYAEIGERMERTEIAIRGLVARGLARLTCLLHDDGGP